MTACHPSARLLVALLNLSQEDETIDVFSIAEEAGLSLFSALRGLEELVQRGLVRGPKMRLTMLGLGLACSLNAGESRQVSARPLGPSGAAPPPAGGGRGPLWRVA